MLIQWLRKVCVLFGMLLWVGRCWAEPVGRRDGVPIASFSSSPSGGGTTPSSSFSTVKPTTASPTIATTTSFRSNETGGQSGGKAEEEFGGGSRLARSRNSSETDLITRQIRLLPQERLNRYKMEAARQLQAMLIHIFKGLSNTPENIPVSTRNAAKGCLAAAQAGRYNRALERNLPTILLQGSKQQGQPGKQLQVILSTLYPHVPSGSQGSLQGLLGFISTNLSNVDNLLRRVLGSVPDLLGGVIKSLTNNLDAVTGALNGTVASLGSLLGSVLG